MQLYYMHACSGKGSALLCIHSTCILHIICTYYIINNEYYNYGIVELTNNIITFKIAIHSNNCEYDSMVVIVRKKNSSCNFFNIIKHACHFYIEVDLYIKSFEMQQ